ncbi:hypothetical protein [Jannaschia sp. LMIT008]|uniref:hypothetical protein n=1 Tax=Jannaschia maritima TaxID=3032585 RepID=UPI002811E0E4|nr:hypothetical protein [Jannaschia sp. LMIT008]
MRHAAACLSVALVALVAAAPAAAERAVSADAFARMVEGRTVTFDRFGAPYGAEQYLDGNRVIWAFDDGACERGIWYAGGSDRICFVYDSDPVPQCWTFLEMPSGAFHARAEGADPTADLVARDWGDEALECPAPDLGV